MRSKRTMGATKRSPLRKAGFVAVPLALALGAGLVLMDTGESRTNTALVADHDLLEADGTRINWGSDRTPMISDSPAVLCNGKDEGKEFGTAADINGRGQRVLRLRCEFEVLEIREFKGETRRVSGFVDNACAPDGAIARKSVSWSRTESTHYSLGFNAGLTFDKLSLGINGSKTWGEDVTRSETETIDIPPRQAGWIEFTPEMAEARIRVTAQMVPSFHNPITKVAHGSVTRTQEFSSVTGVVMSDGRLDGTSTPRFADSEPCPDGPAAPRGQSGNDGDGAIELPDETMNGPVGKVDPIELDLDEQADE